MISFPHVVQRPGAVCCLLILLLLLFALIYKVLSFLEDTGEVDSAIYDLEQTRQSETRYPPEDIIKTETKQSQLAKMKKKIL